MDSWWLTIDGGIELVRVLGLGLGGLRILEFCFCFFGGVQF